MLMLLPAMLIGVLLWAAAPSANTSNGPDDLLIGRSQEELSSTIPSDQVGVAHRALHDIGTQCESISPATGPIRDDVARIITFANRYPDGRFPIDDETANARSLLLVTKYAVDRCAPQEIASIEVALKHVS